MQLALDRIAAIRAAFPAEGLFAHKDWLITPEPLSITPKLANQLEKLGHRLNLFNRACNELYQRSVSGKQPAWIADYLDRGKPANLIEFSRRKEFRADLPLVIRPDLVLTDEGFTIAELDTVPGGIGLTAWLNRAYSQFGTYDVIGGANGMLEGFAKICPGGDIVVSEEAATYRPEMRWLAARLNEEVSPDGSGQQWRVVDPSAFETGDVEQKNLYRFFEHFDLPNIPGAAVIMDAVSQGTVKVTPPFKPYLEEKLWFALFWMRPLREYWRRELSERHFLELQKVIPYTWVLDPSRCRSMPSFPDWKSNRLMS